MSNLNSQGYEPQPEGGQQAGFLTVVTNWAGAIISISLVIGLVVWGYQLTVRDVSEVPVIRALEGPMRVSPTDPGGLQAAHQGLAVNAVQSAGVAEDPADRIVLAPPPVTLADEDLARSDVQPISPDSALDKNTSNMADVVALSENAAAPVETVTLSDEVMAALKEATQGDGLARLPGVKRSARPKARPVVQVAAVVGATTTDGSAEPVTSNAFQSVDADPAQILTGTRLVQLGAFDDEASAKREWGHILDKHGDLLGGKKRLIQTAESGGRSFFRLRVVGFNDLSESRRLCSALLARGTPCIPVTAR